GSPFIAGSARKTLTPSSGCSNLNRSTVFGTAARSSLLRPEILDCSNDPYQALGKNQTRAG
ncbi:hypothetical protein ACFL2Q_18170, partial [Thermodesulfobacteriota bacterium]